MKLFLYLICFSFCGIIQQVANADKEATTKEAKLIITDVSITPIP